MTENRIYQKNEWFITGNGDVNTALLKRQVPRSIIEACGAQLQTIDQISLTTGIPATYIEDELKPLLNAGAVECQNNRYRTSMILRTQRSVKDAEAFLLGKAQSLSVPVSDALEALLPKVRAIGFHGSDLPKERLYWSLIPILMREAITIARASEPALVRGAFPPHPDGSRGWLCAHVAPEGAHRYYSGCNTYFRDGSRFRNFWSYELYSDELNRLLMKLEDVSFTDASVSISDELLLAECIRCDLIVRKDGMLEWNIPVFTPEEAKKMASVVHEAAAELAERLLVSAKAVSKWETGANMPDVSLLIPLADILGITVTELLRCEKNRQEDLNSLDVEKLVKKAIYLKGKETQNNSQSRKKYIILEVKKI